jgi:predicted DNA-binding transcriptional regulator AlpA
MPTEKTFLTTKEVAARVHLSEGALEKMRVTGGGPIFLKLGKAVRYERMAVEAWLDAARRETTTKPLANLVAAHS